MAREGCTTGGRRPSRRPAPVGTVTIAFTDVEGSTVLWENATDAMRIALEIHNDLLRSHLALCGGYEAKTEGDAFMVAFADPRAAVEWALAVQQTLLDAPWPPGLLEHACAREAAGPDEGLLWRGLRVRIGLHMGKPDCRRDAVTGRMDYFGPMVNRAARVAGLAHGGQVLVSQVLWEQVRDQLGVENGPRCFDLGEHWLKGLAEPERLVQISSPSLAERVFPRLKGLPPPANGSEPPSGAVPAEEEDPDRAAFLQMVLTQGPSLDSSGCLHQGRMEVTPPAGIRVPTEFEQLESLELDERFAPPSGPNVPPEGEEAWVMSTSPSENPPQEEGETQMSPQTAMAAKAVEMHYTLKQEARARRRRKLLTRSLLVLLAGLGGVAYLGRHELGRVAGRLGEISLSHLATSAQERMGRIFEAEVRQPVAQGGPPATDPSQVPIHLRSKPSGASVLVDGEESGKTPVIVFLDVRQGPVLVELVKRGYLPGRLIVREARERTFEAVLKRERRKPGRHKSRPSTP